MLGTDSPLVLNDHTHFWSGSGYFLSLIDRTEIGNQINSSDLHVWFGSTINGIRDSGMGGTHCSGWNSASGGAGMATLLITDQVNQNSYSLESGGAAQCGDTKRLMCIDGQ
jgi:hypothetical protein